MVSYCGKSSLFINHFRCITSDITNNKHIPDANGKLCGYVVENGDQLAVMDGSKDVYLYDLENKIWIKQ